MEPSKSKTKSDQISQESPLVKTIKLSIVIATVGVILCVVFLATGT